ncbi:MAG: FAD-dependent thymidylate synthase [Patescibacteria group bacterium]|nr:MAG: FAD-dependent thymidylate synthase [Patescibacteria group bacterium]
MPKFSDEEKALLAPYVTSTEDDIFAVKGLDGMTGAVYARYSRAPGGFRETLLKEFIREGAIDAKKAGDLIERVLIAYGDDSVGELEGAHVSFESISTLVTKEIEDRRIGGSPIEQSTRYVFYDQKDAEGRYRYYRDPAIMASAHAGAYVETMDFIFSTYCELIPPMKAYYEQLKPLDAAEYDVNGDGVKERYAELTDEKQQKAFRITYQADIRSKACDTLRALLPLSTLTNVGIFGNGRFFQTVMTHCYSSALPEARDVAARTHAALEKIIPRYVKRAKANEYTIETRNAVRTLAQALFAGIAPQEAAPVALLDRTATEREADDLTLALMLYPHLTHPLAQIREVVKSLSDEKRNAIIATYIGNRKSRRDRPGRALEGGYPYTFDMLVDYGTYKDLERHRMASQERQKFTPLHGFSMPEDLKKAGFADRAEACQQKAIALYERLLSDFPEQAPYATLHGNLVRWTLGINDRALMHLIELRSTPQGHPTYRRVAQLMHKAVAARSSWRAEAMKFADHNDYFWSRADSEAKQRVKEAELEAKS